MIKRIRPYTSIITLLGISILSVHAMNVQFGESAYQVKDQNIWVASSLPVTFRSDNQIVEVKTSLHASAYTPRTFRITPDDCLQELWVNDQKIESDQIPFCDYSRGRIFDLHGHIRTGDNSIKASVLNHGGTGAFKIEPIKTGFIGSLPYVLFVLALFIGVLHFARTRRTHIEKLLLATFFIGSLIRVGYLAVTPWSLRGHDTGGHIEYIAYAAQNWNLPPIAEGWQYYQPPMYYFLWGSYIRIANALQIASETHLSGVQVGSLLLSFAMLGIGIWVGTMIFPKKEEKIHRLLFAGILAVFPGFVFFSARINNDVLVQFFAFLSLASIYRWWISSPKNTYRSIAPWWMLAIASAAFGILTKMNALLLLPMLGLCLLLKPGISPIKRLNLGIAAAILGLVLTGPYLSIRYLDQGQRHLVGNLGTLNSGLIVDSDLVSLTEFNPVRIVGQPYNNPWSDAAGRDFFWEYLFRSAFFGEFSFGNGFMMILTSLILACAIALLPYTILGIKHMWKNRRIDAIPFLIAGAVLLVGHVIFRQSAPYSCSQDFRYSLLVLIPFAAFTVAGVMSRTGKWKYLSVGSYGIFLGLCTVFLTSIATLGF
jgi:4-amino-4-deoxy-L-arabinose transferase-like glycosyltransferase